MGKGMVSHLLARTKFCRLYNVPLGHWALSLTLSHTEASHAWYTRESATHLNITDQQYYVEQ
jgi:hypothetical protein